MKRMVVEVDKDNPNLYWPESLEKASEIEIMENLEWNLKNLNAMYPMTYVGEWEQNCEEK